MPGYISGFVGNVVRVPFSGMLVLHQQHGMCYSEMFWTKSYFQRGLFTAEMPQIGDFKCKRESVTSDYQGEVICVP